LSGRSAALLQSRSSQELPSNDDAPTSDRSSDRAKAGATCTFYRTKARQWGAITEHAFSYWKNGQAHGPADLPEAAAELPSRERRRTGPTSPNQQRREAVAGLSGPVTSGGPPPAAGLRCG
jgi:hypothetical protein